MFRDNENQKLLDAIKKSDFDKLGNKELEKLLRLNEETILPTTDKDKLKKQAILLLSKNVQAHNYCYITFPKDINTALIAINQTPITLKLTIDQEKIGQLRSAKRDATIKDTTKCLTFLSEHRDEISRKIVPELCGKRQGKEETILNAGNYRLDCQSTDKLYVSFAIQTNGTLSDTLAQVTYPKAVVEDGYDEKTIINVILDSLMESANSATISHLGHNQITELQSLFKKNNPPGPTFSTKKK